MLGSPDVTAYDLRFRLFRVPVRVHPLFWLIMLLISGRADNDLGAAVLFVACAFFSVVVHEFGHALAGRLMGDEPSEIVLYSMGGYCAFHYNRLTRWRRIFMLACGPGAGFLVFALSVGYLVWFGTPPSPALATALHDLAFINLWWGLLNVLPLYPLDGGQITGTVLSMVSPRNGMRWTHVISLLVGGAIALWRASSEDYWMAVWFAYFAFINYQWLQALHYSYQRAGDSDWWRR